MIPTVLRIDIEPDDHLAVPTTLWNGFVELHKIVDELRKQLSEINGSPFRPTWMVRLDPEIERCFGQGDFAIRKYPKIFDSIREKGDFLGIHVHAHRWDDANRTVYSDYADNDWVSNCLLTSVEIYKDCFVEAVKRASQGGYFLTEELVNLSIACGIEVDLTLEPGLKALTSDISFGTYSTAASPDYFESPRHPYFPHKKDYMKQAMSAEQARPLLLLPFTSFSYHHHLKSPILKLKDRLLRKPRPYLPLSMWKEWPSPKQYWDMAALAAERKEAGYLSFAIRTDGTNSVTHQRVRELLLFLPQHPIAKRLLFVDPAGEAIRALARGNLGGQKSNQLQS